MFYYNCFPYDNDVDDEADEDLATYKFKWETGYLNGAAHKVHFLICIIK